VPTRAACAGAWVRGECRPRRLARGQHAGVCGSAERRGGGRPRRWRSPTSSPTSSPTTADSVTSARSPRSCRQDPLARPLPSRARCVSTAPPRWRTTASLMLDAEVRSGENDDRPLPAGLGGFARICLICGRAQGTDRGERLINLPRQATLGPSCYLLAILTWCGYVAARSDEAQVASMPSRRVSSIRANSASPSVRAPTERRHRVGVRPSAASAVR